MKEKKGTQWGNCGGYFIVERLELLWGGETAKLQTDPGHPSEVTALPHDLKLYVFCF